MGLTASSLNLTQYDIADVQQHCHDRFTSAEIQALYQRFRALDKKHKGFISEDELMAIPELAISPLAPRIVQMFQNQNFKDFVRMIAALSPRASREERLRFIFTLYDIDRDGAISRSDLETMVRHLVGSSLSEDEFDALLARAFDELRDFRARDDDLKRDSERAVGISFAEFTSVLASCERLPVVRVPLEA